MRSAPIKKIVKNTLILAIAANNELFRQIDFFEDFFVENDFTNFFCNFRACVPLRPATCNRPSKVLWMVTHFVGWAPLVVMAVIKLSNSSLFSFNFFTRLSIALLLKLSDSPPCKKQAPYIGNKKWIGNFLNIVLLVYNIL